MEEGCGGGSHDFILFGGGQKGERESKKKKLFFNAPDMGINPEKEIEHIKEIISDLLETSDMIQDILRDTLENT